MSVPRIGGALLKPSMKGSNFGGPCAAFATYWFAKGELSVMKNGAGATTPYTSTGGDHSVTKIAPIIVQPHSSQHGEWSFFCSDDASLQQVGCWQHDSTSITSSVQQVVSAPVVVFTRQQQSGIVNVSTMANRLVIIPRRRYICDSQYTPNSILGK